MGLADKPHIGIPNLEAQENIGNLVARLPLVKYDEFRAALFIKLRGFCCDVYFWCIFSV